MINIEKRKKDFIKLIENLDISPTMFKNAKEKYENIGSFFNDNGLEVDLYPQGSFSLGTVVRPYRDNKETDYDLDCICLLYENKNNTTPKDIKLSVGRKLLESGIYNEKLQEEWEKCWTIKYADVNNVGFNLDIVPAVKEDEGTLIDLIVKSDNNAKKVQSSIAITNKINENNYVWSTANPKGYKEWFDEINNPFKEYIKESIRKKIYIENRNLFNSIEEIPEELERSPLQRVIQILKRHRDVYFNKIKKEKYKPISAIITTITAQIAEQAPKYYDISYLLDFVVREFEIYAEHNILSKDEFEVKYKNKKIIKKNENRWVIQNPVNPKDNLADSWNDEPLKARLFFQWVKQVKIDFIESFNYEDKEFINILENSLGSNYVSKNINLNDYNIEKPEPLRSTTKSWSE